MLTAGEYGRKIVQLQRDRQPYQAYEMVKEAINCYPTSPFLLKSEVYILYQLKKIKKAKEKAERIIEQLKYDPFFLTTYLKILEAEGAKEDIERLIENIPLWGIRDEDFYVFLIKAVLRIFGKEKAIEVGRQITPIIEGSSAIKHLSGEISGEGVLDKTFQYYKEKLKGKTSEEIIKELESISVLPDYANDYQLHLYLAQIYKETKKYDKAIKTYKYLLGLKDDEFTRKMMGYTYYKSGDRENALIYLRDSFIKYPHDHYLYRTIFKIFEAASDYNGFEKLTQEALGANPEAKHLFGLLKKAEKWKKD